MKVTNNSTKQEEIQTAWHLVDVKDKVLGRVSTDIAKKLMGKSKSYFVRNLDCGDYVVVTNAKYVAVTGHKEKEKQYTHYSGEPGGLKKRFLWQLRESSPTEIIRHAVSGMLPKNRLRDQLLKRLYIYPEEVHPYKNKFAQHS